MRVIAGSVKGFPLKAPKGTMTRPTSDRVKEAIFSMIGPYFSGGRCLDLFAGSGALGIEALSRGMDRAIFVDQASTGTILDNVTHCRMDDRATIIRAKHLTALRRLDLEQQVFDLVFLDPPYRFQWIPDTISELLRLQMLASGAYIVAELDASQETPVIDGVTLHRESKYGSTKVCIYFFESEGK